MRISDFKRTARASLKNYWADGALLTFLVFLISSIPPIALEIYVSGGVSNWIDQETLPLPVYVVELIYNLALIPLSVGLVWFFLSLVRQKEPRITEAFAIYKNGVTVLRMIWASILMGIFIFLWSLLFLIPGIIKALSYSQTYYLLKDHPEWSALQAITESKKRMKGYKWKFFLLNLSFIGWAILAAIPLLIGFLWLVPYMMASLAAFYHHTIANKENEPTVNE
ncbi:DUF975 family protein [Sporolactobacillus sp. THM7-7]|nr:DUF975 family protein [Sporolactobacillus sp. THM7-7]